jgi:hypothetical protein
VNGAWTQRGYRRADGRRFAFPPDDLQGLDRWPSMSDAILGCLDGFPNRRPTLRPQVVSEVSLPTTLSSRHLLISRSAVLKPAGLPFCRNIQSETAKTLRPQRFAKRPSHEPIIQRARLSETSRSLRLCGFTCLLSWNASHGVGIIFVRGTWVALRSTDDTLAGLAVRLVHFAVFAWRRSGGLKPTLRFGGPGCFNDVGH